MEVKVEFPRSFLLTWVWLSSTICVVRDVVHHRMVVFALGFIGFSSMVAQVVLMRELLIIFYGNELSLGVTLAGWLFWGGLGSLVMGPFLGRRIGRKLLFFVLGEILLALFLPLSVVLTRLIPFFLGITSGEIIGTLPMIVSSFLIVCPISFLGGTLFVLGCEIYRRQASEAAVPIGYVYILEAAGATIGGIVASFFLIRLFPSLSIVLPLATLNACFAFILSWQRERVAAGVAAVILCFCITSSCVAGNIRLYTLQHQWRNYELLTSENSIYENITVVSRDSAVSFFANGLLTFTAPDTATSEMKAHIPLLEHSSPKKVLLLGGGGSGIIDEILKHNVERIDYVEIDPLLIELTQRYLTVSWKEHPQVNVITMDGRLFVKQTREIYDVVILNIAEPHTAQTNRFYTVDFYRELHPVLSDSGLICFSLYSNPNYMSEEARELYMSLKKTLESVFEDVLITPGATNFFLASKQRGILTDNWRELIERAARRGVETRYVREYYLFADFSHERFERTLQALVDSGKVRINSDFKPISYYYDMVFWSTYFSKAGYLMRRILRAVTERRTWVALFIVSGIILVPSVFLRRKRSSYGILVPVATTGFAEITFQVVTLLSFQILYGYVFYKLTLILTSYMLGLIFGGFWITKKMERGGGTAKTYLFTQFSIVLYPLFLPVFFLLFSLLRNGFSDYLGSNVVFPLLPVIPGIIGGFQFPLANKLFINVREGTGAAAGMTYGLDLVGSCVGALLVSVFLIPIIGILNTCIQVSVLNFASLILVAVLVNRTSLLRKKKLDERRKG
jgi:spermidine synthase